MDRTRIQTPSNKSYLLFICYTFTADGIAAAQLVVRLQIPIITAPRPRRRRYNKYIYRYIIYQYTYATYNNII